MKRRYQILLVCVVGVSARALAAERQLRAYFFDEPRSLTLDTTAVAILDDVNPWTIPAKWWARYDIIGDDINALPITGWSIVSPPARWRSIEGIAGLVRELSRTNKIGFVSPVFVGDDGGLIIVTPRILVGFHAQVSADRAEAILDASGAGDVIERDWAGMKRAYVLHSSARNGYDVLAAANDLAIRPEVRFAEPDMIFTGRGGHIPNDPGFGNCWGLHNTGQFGGTADMDMDGPEAWDVTTGDPSVIVVIIDTGVQQDHPDLNQLPGTDTTSQGPGDGGPVNACDNHGTAVAGCVSAIIDNHLGTVGIAPDCPSASARTFISNIPCTGGWTSVASWTVETLAWAESIGARVTNNSNFYGFTSSAIAQKYADTRADGMIHFGSAGNDATQFVTYPASLPSVNAVAALDNDGQLTGFSNYGPGLSFSAPGIDIYTTDRSGSAGWSAGDYVFAAGTSFASPYTAGVAALLLSVNPCTDIDRVELALQQSSVDLGLFGFDATYGWGFVNAHEAVTHIMADFDDDGDTDLDEHSAFVACLSGPIPTELPPGCELFDFDCDNDVDLLDWRMLQRAFTGDCGVEFLAHPEDASHCEDAAAFFEVQAAGPSLTYQWMHDWAFIPGATESTLVIDPVTPGSAGVYAVLVSTDCTTKSSNPAELLVSPPPEIPVSPEDVMICLGQPAQFSIEATGVKPLSYQWQRDGEDLKGETEPLLFIEAVMPEDVGAYRCIVTSLCGQNTTSDAANLFAHDVEITEQPVGAEPCVGDNVFLFVGAIGGPAYQWFKDDESIPGATSFFLSILDATLEDSGAYHVEATNDCNGVTSDVAIVEVICDGACPSCAGSP